jgi:DNA-directed RNA polymerase subunit RPC12/RpoP
VIKEINGKTWYFCPYCGKALFPVRPDTKVEHMPFRCKACKHDMEVNIA